MRVPGVRFVQGRNRYGTSTKYGIAVHATANTASAAGEASYAQRRTDGTSSHFYIDAIEVVQSLDTNDRAGHAGSDEGNTYAIALEFTGLNSWSRAKWLASVCWDKVGAMLAAVSKAHGIPAKRLTVAAMEDNPRSRGAYDHNQMRLAWAGTDHTDPGPNFPWDKLLAVWQQHLNPPKQQQENDMAFDNYPVPAGVAFNATGAVVDKSRIVAFGIPAGAVIVTLAAVSDDYGTVKPTKLRVAVHNGAGWKVTTVTVDATKPAVRVPLANAAAGAAGYKVAVGRVAGGSEDAPVSLLLTVTALA